MRFPDGSDDEGIFWLKQAARDVFPHSRIPRRVVRKRHKLYLMETPLMGFDEITYNELAYLVVEALEQLPDDEEKIMKLIYGVDNDFQLGDSLEVSKRLGIPYQAILAKIESAKQRFRDRKERPAMCLFDLLARTV